MSNHDQAAIDARPRLSRLEAAWVIARRDFIAVLFSRAFLFFLIGPLFPVLVGGLAGSIGGQNSRAAVSSEIGLAMSADDNAAMIAAAASLKPQLRGGVPDLVQVPEAEGNSGFDARDYLEQRKGNYVAIVGGTLSAPEITATEGQIARWKGPVELLAGTALGSSPSTFPSSSTALVTSSAASERSLRLRTAGAAQMILFLLTMLLGGMVLSNLAEEKGNKIIEILAAALPMDAVFMGKLFAMLGVSFVGIAVWGAFGWGFWAVAEDAIVTVTQTNYRELPGPAVGWPMFMTLAILYFSMAYLLLGSLFLTIGGMASTVREVQTMSMPVTMMQLMVFFLAAYTVTMPGSVLETVAIIFPLSSPFAMLARAALEETLWTHALALLWQGFAVIVLVKGGSMLFRKRVMKSGGGGHAKKRRSWFGKRGNANSAQQSSVEPAE
ncbi:ABC transporter permease [Erythrobacter crassostreae]|uniref:ABC transporter permease n=1 Tax=Erythrobacter crassostreae TaxID=2828328 RepID=A0A9X1F1Q6_9SPHN|nr:ABC transporter permease [Erythrobacter crassostrea]MBV7258705.1 ABC transporter permease [Erythrobacter crassostrea]